MTHYIRCPECSFCIGAYQEFIDNVRIELVKESMKGKYADYDPEKLTFTNKVVPVLQEVFDALEIEHRCCRTHLLAKTNFNTYT